MRSIHLKALLLGFVLVGFGTVSSNAQPTITQLINYTNVWKYEQSGIDLGTAWRSRTFVDTAWPSGPGPLGFLANEPLPVGSIRTVLNRFTNGVSGTQPNTYYFRYHFNYTGPSAGVSLNFSNMVDDGAVFYLNGNEIARVAMPVGAPTYNSSATRSDDVLGHGIDFFNVPGTGLVQGDNVIAVEVHQNQPTGNDIVFGMALSAEIPDPNVQLPINLILITNQVWKYEDSGTDLGNVWRTTNYNDSAWLSGRAPLGYETAAMPYPIVTANDRNANMGGQVITYYYRATFNFNGNPNDVDLVFTNEVDDGLVVYLNNVEVMRQGVAANPTTYADFANVTVGEAVLTTTVVQSRGLVQGNNVIAVEVKQVNATSSDLVFALGLTARFLTATALTITNQPADLTVEEFKSATFSVGYSGNRPRFQWTKDGTNITGATTSSFRIENVLASDAGLYQVVITNQLGIVTSRQARLTVVPDTNAPVLLSADGTRNATTIILTYSELVSPVTATNIIHYKVTNTLGSTLTISRAVLTNGTNVILTTSAGRVVGGNYLLFATNITDRVMASNRLALAILPITSRIQLVQGSQGWAFYDPLPGLEPLDPGPTWTMEGFDDSNWGGGSGAFVYDLTQAELAVERQTILSQGAVTKYFRTRFVYSGSASGATITFRHVVDDGAIFYINGVEVYRYNLPATGVDHTTPGTAVGTANFIEATIPADLVKAGTNLLAVELHGRAVNDQDWIFYTDLNATLNSSVGGPVLVLGGGPLNQSVAEGERVSFSINSVGAARYQWFRNNVAITGATNSVYTISNAAFADNNVMFRATAFGSTAGTMADSTNAILRVTADTNAPTLVSIFGSGNQLNLTFSENIDPVTGGNPANYTITNRLGAALAISSIVVSNRNVIITMADQTAVGDVVVLTGVKDGATIGNAVSPCSGARVGFSPSLVPMDASWKFDQSGTDLGTAWRDPGYNDAAWPEGQALLAFETAALTEPIRTIMASPQPKITFYYRTHFNFNGNPAGVTLQLRHYIDDGAIFYLNGQEFYRIRMPNTNDPVTYLTLADPTAVGDAALAGPFPVYLPSLQAGDNVLAVELHQVTSGSTDIVMGASLEGTGSPSVVLTGGCIEPCVGPARLSIAREGTAQVRITWAPTCFRLQQATQVTGPWSDVTQATSPFVTTRVTSRFYRVLTP